MTATPDPQLVQAYRQIRSGHVSQARQALAAYLAAYPHSADAWWLMAHAVTDPAEVRRCLEETLARDPNYALARASLDRLPPQTPPFDPLRDFVMPANLAAIPTRAALVPQPVGADGGAGSLWQAALDAAPPQGAITTLEAAASPAAEQRETRQARVLGLLTYGVLTTVLVIVLALVVVEGLSVFRDRVLGTPPPPGTLQGDVFSLRRPAGWAGNCESGGGAQVCTFATERRFDLLDPYTRGRENLGNEELLTTVNRTLFGGEETPEQAAMGIVVDYSQQDVGYQYIRRSIIWQEGEYGSKQGRTSYVRGYDLWMEYDKANPMIDGAPGYIYWLTGKDVTGLVLSRRGYFIICDVYVPHDDRLLLMTIVGYSATDIDDLPRGEIERMIQSIQFD